MRCFEHRYTVEGFTTVLLWCLGFRSDKLLVGGGGRGVEEVEKFGGSGQKRLGAVGTSGR